MIKTYLVSFLIIIFSVYVRAQDAEVFKPDSVKRAIQATGIEGSLKIDGLMNETEWKMAIRSPSFIQVEPLQGSEPKFPTDVFVLYNRQYLYIGLFAHDPQGKKAIRSTDFKRDFDYRTHDLISIAFDGFNDKRNAMTFVTNAYGVQRDLLSFDDLYYDIDWDGLWRVRTTRTDSGWAAELAIPWQTLRYPSTSDSIQNWGFNVYRNRRLTNEISAFSLFPRVYSSQRMDYAGVLKGLRPPPPRPNIRVQPYFLASYDRYKNAAPDIKERDTHYKLGGELKWAINTNAILDLTANTDFAQADADKQVNNVTRFSVFFPEKRPFFLENASLFGGGVGPFGDGSGGSMRVQPFFSRSIGLDDAGNPIPLVGGGRFVYRSSKRNYGAMAIRQEKMDSIPATNFLVARYSENFGKQNRIGGMVSVKNRSDRSNITSTLDGFFRIGESQSLNTMLVHSYTTPGSRQGIAGFAQFVDSKTKYKIWWTESVVTRNFNPEMGFVSRTDVIGTTPGMNWYYRGRHLPFKKIIRAFEPGFLPEFYHQASTGKLIETQWYFFPVWLNFQSGAYFGYAIVPSYQHLTEAFEPLGVVIGEGKYRYMRQQIWASTDASKILNLQVIYTWGNYYDGKLNSGEWQLQFAPIPHISIIGRFNRNHFMDVGIFKSNDKVDLYSVEGRFAFNPRLQLIAFYQENSENKARNYNIRLSWEYQPLSYIYLVYNHRGFNNLQSVFQTEDHAIGKISYLKQF